MLNLFGAFDWVLTLLGDYLLADHRAEVNDHLDLYYRLDDDELQRRCRDALQGVVEPPRKPPTPWLRRLSLPRLLGLGGDGSSIPLGHLALAIEAFRRAPADLEPGSALYPCQCDAALALTQRFVLQMNTGEGKTYALLPAAFALACRYERVYVVCANSYLAWRDATRTQNYWRFLGVAVGLCLEDTTSAEWDRRVIYTTLPALLFATLRNELSFTAPEHPVLFGAALLDEADAILLDQAHQPYALVQDVQTTAFDWSRALEIAQKLTPEKHLTIDQSDLSASLTVDGEAELLRHLAADGTTPPPTGGRYLTLRRAVELAYVAVRVAQEDVHYIAQADRLVAVDRTSGRPNPGSTPAWLIPLEFSRGLSSRPRSMELHRCTATVLLNEFQHLAGLSGTIVEDAPEYFFTYQLLTTLIPPRVPRRHGELDDLVYLKKSGAVAALCAAVVEAHQAGRPVLVGTQTIEDAERVHHRLQETLPAGARLHLLTGKNERGIAEVFSRAGEVGSVVVATQLAGRGVDIRLTDEARASGGMALFGLSHAEERRFDLQLLGRAGRQGDPFTARFIWSIEDRLWQLIGADWTAGVLRGLGLEEDQAIESGMVSKQLRNVQQTLHRNRFLHRSSDFYIADADTRVRAGIKQWFEYGQLADTGGEPACAEEYVRWLVQRFVETVAAPVLGRSRFLPLSRVERALLVMRESLRLPAEAPLPRAAELEGLTPPQAAGRIGERLGRAVLEAMRGNAELQELCSQRDFYQREQWSLSRLYQRVEEVLARAVPVPPNGEGSPVTPPDPAAAGEPAPIPPEEDWEGLLAAVAAGDVARLQEAAAAGQEQCDRVLTPQAIEEEISGLEANLHEPGNVALLRDLSRRYTALLDATNRRLGELEAVGELSRCGDRLPGRTPRRVAAWTVRLAWMEFLEERDRIVHRAGQMERPKLEYSRLVNDRILHAWKRVDEDLPGRVLGNLLRCDRPSTLDDVFLLEDHRVYSPRADEPEAFKWERAAEALPAAPAAARTDSEQLVAQFAENQPAVWLGESEEERSRVRYLLREFLRRSPLHALQSPGQIQTALEDWFTHEAALGIPAAQRRQSRRWLRRFLLFLRRRRLVGPLPTIRDWAVTGLRRCLQTLTERPSAVTALATVVFVAGFVLLSAYGGFALSRPLAGLGRLFDDVVAGGLLARGTVTAVAFPALLLGALAVYLLAPWQSGNVRGTGYDRLVVPVAQLALAAWLTGWDWSHFTFLHLGAALFVFLGLLLVAWVTQRAVWGLELWTGIGLMSGWLAYTVAGVLLPDLAAASGNGPALAGILAGLTVLYWLWTRLNARELVVVSARVGSHSDPGQAEEVPVARNVYGDCGPAPHVFALLFSWLAYEIAATAGLGAGPDRQAVALAAYLATAVLWITLVLRKRFDPRLWQFRLTQNHQLLEGTTSDAEVRSRLRRTRNVLLGRELLLQTAAALAVAWLLRGLAVELPGFADFPLAPVVLAGGFLFAWHLRAFGQELYHFLLSRIPVGQNVLDLSRLPDPSEEQDSVRWWLQVLRARLGLAFSMLLLGIKIVQWVWQAIQTAESFWHQGWRWPWQ
jgi:hypothetical protein